MSQNDKIIQWFPGHMAKTRRLMRENIRLVDAVIELRDARIVHSSRNPEIEKIVGDKPRLILLNKADSADDAITKQWKDFFAKKGIIALPVDCRSGKGLNQLGPALREVCASVHERNERRNMSGRALKIMVVGIPNVGKSSFINRMAGGRRAKVEDRPGVTRGRQWIKLADGTELLDMPGVLWPKFEDPIVGRNLAYTGAVKDQVMDLEDLNRTLLELMRDQYPNLLCARYHLKPEDIVDKTGNELLSMIAQKRGMLIAGGQLDTQRAAAAVLDEFRGGVIGKISLEYPRSHYERNKSKN